MELHEYQDKSHIMEVNCRELQAKLDVTLDEKNRLDLTLQETLDIYEKLEKSSILLR